MSKNLKLYLDFMSQPSRALYIIFKLAKTPFDVVQVDLKAGEHFGDKFQQINRFQKVPCIVDENHFNLSESIAIIRYLDGKGILNEKLYPKELKARALVDEYLEWQHNNTRIFCAVYFQLTWLKPILTKEPSPPEWVTFVKTRMVETLDIIENIWLKEKKFLAGNSLTVADIFGACEIEQTRLGGYNAVEGRPKMAAWFERVKNEANPYYDEAHARINFLIEKGKKRSASKL